MCLCVSVVVWCVSRKETERERQREAPEFSQEAVIIVWASDSEGLEYSRGRGVREWICKKTQEMIIITHC